MIPKAHSKWRHSYSRQPATPWWKQWECFVWMTTCFFLLTIPAWHDGTALQMATAKNTGLSVPPPPKQKSMLSSKEGKNISISHTAPRYKLQMLSFRQYSQELGAFFFFPTSLHLWDIRFTWDSSKHWSPLIPVLAHNVGVLSQEGQVETWAYCTQSLPPC